MCISNSYNIIKSALNGEKIESSELEHSIELIMDVMQDWLDTYEYSTDFEILMCNIEKDYAYTGTLYRGITLLKDECDFRNKIEHLIPQSFTKNKSIAISFATNNMVTSGNMINEIKEDSEVIPVIIEIEANQTGIDLDKFSRDLIRVCKGLTDNKEFYLNYEDFLNYAVDEEEVLVYPVFFRENNFISYSI